MAKQDTKQLKNDLKELQKQRAALTKETEAAVKAHETLMTKKKKAGEKLDGQIAKLEDKLAPKAEV